jgi:hypothetical protein
MGNLQGDCWGEPAVVQIRLADPNQGCRVAGGLATGKAARPRSARWPDMSWRCITLQAPSPAGVRKHKCPRDPHKGGPIKSCH